MNVKQSWWLACQYLKILKSQWSTIESISRLSGWFIELHEKTVPKSFYDSCYHNLVVMITWNFCHEKWIECHENVTSWRHDSLNFIYDFKEKVYDYHTNTIASFAVLMLIPNFFFMLWHEICVIKNGVEVVIKETFLSHDFMIFIHNYEVEVHDHYTSILVINSTSLQHFPFLWYFSCFWVKTWRCERSLP